MRLPRSALAVLALALASCAPASVASTPQEQLTPPSVITVENQRTEDATIYLEHGGEPTRRLGVVGSLTTASFILRDPDGAANAEFQFVAKMFANGWTDASDPVPALQGVHYRWQLAPRRGTEFLSYQRYASADGTSTPAPSESARHDGDRLPGNPGTRAGR